MRNKILWNRKKNEGLLPNGDVISIGNFSERLDDDFIEHDMKVHTKSGFDFYLDFAVDEMAEAVANYFIDCEYDIGDVGRYLTEHKNIFEVTDYMLLKINGEVREDWDESYDPGYDTECPYDLRDKRYDSLREQYFEVTLNKLRELTDTLPSTIRTAFLNSKKYKKIVR